MVENADVQGVGAYPCEAFTALQHSDLENRYPVRCDRLAVADVVGDR
jgi:hypothetical protein